MRHAAAFAALGVLSAIGVAWLCAATLDPEPANEKIEKHARPADDEGNPDFIDVRRYERAGSLHFSTSYCRDAAYTPEERTPTPRVKVEGWAAAMVRPWEAEGREWPAFVPPIRRFAVVAYEVYSYGWPLPAVYRSVWATPAATVRRYEWHEIGMVVIPGTRTPGARGRGFNEPIKLPYLPVWSGLAVDAAVWGAVWWGVMAGIGALRRWRRRRRGRCERCAYDLRGTVGEVCPECGGPRTAALART